MTMSTKQRTVPTREQAVPSREKNRRLAIVAAALVGAALSLGLGVKWVLFVNSEAEKKIIETIRPIASTSQLTEGLSDVRARVADWDNKSRACYVLLISAVLGLVGGYLAYKGQEKPAGIVLVVGGVLPLVFALSAVLATAPLLVAGALNFMPKTPEVEGEPPVKRKRRGMGPWR
jgi:hypothetical protein